MIGSPLAMAEWIEIMISECRGLCYVSPLAMAEWIEIGVSGWDGSACFAVSASDGGVD